MKLFHFHFPVSFLVLGSSKILNNLGLVKEHIPSEDDFSNFLARCGGEKYREILQVLVDIAYSLSFVSGPLIASTDGTLFSTLSRFKGCDYFEKECQRIQITGLVSRIKRKVNKLLDYPEKIVLGKKYQVTASAPLTCFLLRERDLW